MRSRQLGDLVFSQFKQALDLPIAFSGYRSGGTGGVGRSMDSLQCINCSTNGMGGDVRRCHRLAGSTGSRARRIVLPYLAGRSMRIKRSLTNNGHFKLPSIQPCLQRFESVSRAMVVRILILKIRQDTLSAINRPDG